MKRVSVVVVVGLAVLLLLSGLPGTAGRLTGAPAAAAAAPERSIAAAPNPPAASAALSAPAAQALIARLQAAGGPVEVAAHLRTGRARFIGADAASTGFRGIETGIANQPEAASRAFLAEYGSLFGISDPAALRVMTTQAATGRSYVRFQQTLNSIPVMSGELIIQTDASGRVWSASGEALPDDMASGLPSEPAITGDAAAKTALAATVKYEKAAANALTVSAPALWYYDSDLLGAPGPSLTSLVWRVEVAATDLAPVRELVLVDALTGKVTLHFNQVADAKTRTVFNNNNNRSAGLPGGGPVRTEGQAATGNQDVDLAYDYSGDTYDFYNLRFGRNSLDGKGMALISTVKFCYANTDIACPLENAFWNGQQMVYGDGYSKGDDVVGHELSHGVTNFSSNLNYYMQSGALNESLSDIFGEFIDLTNGKGNDSAGARWLMGEDIPIGAIRNMANPAQFNNPDSTSSSNYVCDTSDNGGVHSNSGVSNRAAVLMVDGGSLNGKNVTSIGLEKSAQIWYRMATTLLTSGSEYQDVYSLLPQACTDLVSGGGVGVTAADCQQVKNAVAAVQMDQEPPMCASPEAPVCPAGQTATDVYNENFENQSLTLSRWVNSNTGVWFYPQTNNPYQGYEDFHYASSGLYHLWADDPDSPSDATMAMKTGVTVPQTGSPYFRFRHAFAFESDFFGNYDAGVLEYSANGGPWTDAGPLFVDNGYNGDIDGNPSNPLYNRRGFVDVSWGYGSSRLDLSSLRGQSVQFRFRVASDEQVGNWGWFVDDVRLYSCAATQITPTPTATQIPSPTATFTRAPSFKPRFRLPLILR